LLLAILFFLIFSAYHARRLGKRKMEARPEIKGMEEKAGEERIGERTERTFKDLFDALVNRYGLKKGLTPRELLEKLKNQPFAEKLKEVVELHEKFAYAGLKLSGDEEERFFKLLIEILQP